MDKFWLWLLRLTYGKLLVINPRMPAGVPGNRDPESKCPGYEPRERRQGDWSDCESDGHYLCKECCHLHLNDPIRRISLKNTRTKELWRNLFEFEDGKIMSREGGEYHDFFDSLVEAGKAGFTLTEVEELRNG